MIAFPREWVQHFGVNLATAYPPETGARFRYHERLDGALAFSEVVRRCLASDPDFHVRGVSEMTRTVTCEGEYGAWIAVEGRRQGGAAMRFIGAVFLDDFTVALDAVAIIPPRFREVELLSLELLHGLRFGLAGRPRRFYYVPPVGWQGIPSGPTANWYPPDFPNNRSTIVVPPAQRLDGSPERAIETTFEGVGAGLAVTASARDELVSAAGVRGHCLRVQGDRAGLALHREVVVFVVEPYVYRMRLETATADRLLDLRTELGSVAGSFRPLPDAEEIRLGRAFASTANVFSHWVS